MANKNIRSLSSRKGLDDNLFENIAELSSKQTSESEFKELAKRFMVDDSVIFGTASFYDFTREQNRAKKIHVCSGTACMVAGKQSEVSSKLKSHFKDEHIGHAACVGRCHSNNALMYNDKTFSIGSGTDLNKILNSEINQENEYHIESNCTPILTSKIKNLQEFYNLSVDFLPKKREAIEELIKSNLRGRGGAGFPFWFKLDAVYKEENIQKYIVCNADEGDPGAYSDMYLMEHQPHKVLFGMYMAGLIAGADTGVLYIRGEYPDSIRIIADAIEEFKMLDIPYAFKFKIIRGQGSYVCGEETALLNSIEGLRPEVRVRPPYPAQYGLYGKPTVLSNVETFANLHWILENGGNAYSNLGTDKSTGTKLVSLDSFFNRPGMYEVEMGTSLQTVFEELGQGYKSSLKGFQIGGPLGGILPIEKIKDLTLDFESFSSSGFLLGHASVVSIPTDFPMIQFLEHLMEFTADESCGKCYPCRIGSHRGMEMLQKAQNDNYKIDRQLFDDLIETLEIGSLCALGGGVPLPIKNALQYFSDELNQYFTT
ncbi:NADH-ubiquinone oxidoreductase-F iron-sulfur binding region domain-containing protein [Urechidicola vernalis]|uniref:NADH-ubiquinone oxidoreductase-F iron-sulfur binding region domain-containing protein n=1 Tax=Urechidicola vernalis TaxID=3075600 RepID=A0ABU2Y810_9FLAO|nr:NADH-ubiquinone oxidoreductase-F iron-sulfur binding region domain-containing protein [Urechidicola sp. P050]MDT0554332.1 NADH-ubiquinone oxidoreductase-F iron-sulfur binding region domain-containing protein [Urechidicola sp. P050]